MVQASDGKSFDPGVAAPPRTELIERARETYRRLLMQQPDSADALLNLGRLFRREAPVAARTLIRRALRLPGVGAVHWFHLGSAEDSAGDADAALDCLDRCLRLDPGFGSGHHKRGLILNRLHRWNEGVAALRKAAALAPGDRHILCDLGLGLQNSGADNPAERLYRRSWRLEPADERPLQLLGGLLIRNGRIEDAAPLMDRLMQTTGTMRRDELVCNLLAVGLNNGPVPTTAQTPAIGAAIAIGSISVIICSITPAKFAAANAMFHRVLRGTDYEIIGIHDARSMSEGYNRGLRQSRGDILIFCHDDIAILNEDLPRILGKRLAEFDVIGVAGTLRLDALGWWRGERQFLRGVVAHGKTTEDGILCDVYGVDGPVAAGIQVMDGLFLAARRAVVEAVQFDEENFRGFHFYDMDFTYSAYLAGYRLAVCSEIVIIHESAGNLKGWHPWKQRFLEKFRGRLPHLSTAEAEPLQSEGKGWSTVRLTSRDYLRSFFRVIVTALSTR